MLLKAKIWKNGISFGFALDEMNNEIISAIKEERKRMVKPKSALKHEIWQAIQKGFVVFSDLIHI